MTELNKHTNATKLNKNKTRNRLVSGVFVTLLMITGVELDTNKTIGVDKPEQLEQTEYLNGLTEEENKVLEEETGYSKSEEAVESGEIKEVDETVEEAVLHEDNEVKEDAELNETEESLIKEDVGVKEDSDSLDSEEIPEIEPELDKTRGIMQPRIMRAMYSTTSYGITSMLDGDRLTNKPVDIIVAGQNKGSVQSIEMVISPKLGRNYAERYNTDERPMPGYSLVYELHKHEELIGEEMTVSFEAKTTTPGSESVINSIIYGGHSYPIEGEVTDEFKQYQYVIPKNTNISDLTDYTYIEIKRGNYAETLRLRNVKVELGNTATPYTKTPDNAEFWEVSNLFDKTEWLKTTPEQKPKTTGVPYMDIQLEPNTEYTLSTDIGLSPTGYYDVFFMVTNGFASSTINGVGIGEPRTVTTKEDGIIRIAMREYDAELKDGTNTIMVNKGKSALPEDSKAKTYSVTSNGNYTFRVTYKDGSTRDKTVNVNNFVSIKGIPYRWTDANVQLTMDASGGNPAKVKRIQLPNKQWVNADTASYRVTDNGTYTFIGEDLDGNTLTENVVINKIDKGNPTIRANHEPTTWTNQAVDVEVTAYDGESGVEKVEMTGRPAEAQNGGDNLFLNSDFSFGNNNWVGNELTGNFEIKDKTLSASGSGRFIYSIISMPVGEYYTVSFDARKDGEPARAVPYQSGGFGNNDEGYEGVVVGNEWERHSVVLPIQNTNTISFSLKDTANTYQFRNMKIEKGKVATPWIPAVGDGVGKGSSVFPVVNNGVYTFTATDYAGNTAEVKHEVTNIDSIAPGITITKNISGYTKGNEIELTYKVTDEQSGVKRITLPDGTIVTNATQGKFKVNKNGDYDFKLEDNVGNVYTHTESITQFDKEAPTVKVTGNPTDWTASDTVTLKVTASDTQSGVSSIKLPDNKVVTTSTANFTVSENGDYTFVVTDKVGNTTTQKVTVDKIMTPYMFYLFDANGKPLTGAGFNLMRDGVKHAYATSDVNGLVDFGKVPPVGRYTIVQVKAPDGYVIDPSEKDVEVGDTTEPEEFISYPRGDILPATGTNETMWLTGVVMVVVTIISTIGGLIRFKTKDTK